MLLNFCGFIRFVDFFFFKIDEYNMDEHLESSWRLVYYQVSGEQGIAGCSHRSDIYPRECGLVRASLFTDHHRISLIFAC